MISAIASAYQKSQNDRWANYNMDCLEWDILTVTQIGTNAMATQHEHPTQRQADPLCGEPLLEPPTSAHARGLL